MIEVELPDGAIAEFPDGTDHEVIKSALAKQYASTKPAAGVITAGGHSYGRAIPSYNQPGPDLTHKTVQGFKDFAGGTTRGAGSIGATILTPYDYLAGNTESIGNPERRHAMDEGLQSLGVDTESLPFRGGKIASEIMGTAPLGGILGNAVGKASPVLGNAIGSGGFSLGQAGTNSALANALLRVGGGAINGGITAGAVNPDDAGVGALLGGAMPVVAKGAGELGSLIGSGMESGARKLMNSALKPTIKMHQSGDAAQAVDTLLQRGISPTEKGVEKLGGLIEDVDNQISGLVSSSNKTISKQKVINYLNDVRNKFGSQVNPSGDLSAIQNAGDQFAAHPGIPTDDISVPLAQELKRGTYKVLSGKYGQLGSADTEAQKALARGLKEELVNAVPEIGPLNAEQSALITAKKVAGRRALMDANNNPLGLAPLTTNPGKMAAFLLDRSVAAKALGARGMYQAAQGTPNIAGLLENLSPTQRAALITALADQ